MTQDLLTLDLAEVMATALATGLFRSLCTIQQHDGTLDPGGAPVYGNTHWTTVFDAIPCISAPTSEVGISANEARSLIEVVSTSQQHVLLNGYYPGIVSSMRAVIDGVAYDIVGVEDDSQHTMTRMEVRLARI